MSRPNAGGRRRPVAPSLLSALLVATSLGAQSPADSTRPLFVKADLWIAAGFVGTTVAMFPLDENVARQIRQDSTFNGFTQKSAVGFETISTPGAYVIGASIYLFGRVTKRQDITDFGWHGTEAVRVANGLTGFLKGTLGRARPFVSNDSNPRDFRLGGGFGQSERQSFPSGHTSPACAAAAAVTLFVRTGAPSGERTKGPDEPSLLVLTGAPEQHPHVLSSGDRVRPGDYVQVAYSAKRDGFGAVAREGDAISMALERATRHLPNPLLLVNHQHHRIGGRRDGPEVDGRGGRRRGDACGGEFAAGECVEHAAHKVDALRGTQRRCQPLFAMRERLDGDDRPAAHCVRPRFRGSRAT
jgi:hypothetical protein